MSKERVRGFFWVRFSNLSEWEIAKYIPGFGWSLFWTEEYLKDSRLHQIDERPIVREENKPDNSDAKLLLRFMDAQFRIEHEKWITYRGALSDHDEDVDLRPEVLRMKAGMHELIRIVRELKKEIDPTWSEKRNN